MGIHFGKNKVLIIILASVLVVGFVFVFGLTSLTYGNQFNGDISQTTNQNGNQYENNNQNNNNSSNTNQDDTSYTVTLNHQGGTSISSSVTVFYNRPMPSVSKPTRLYYTFAGYYSQPNGEGTAYYSANMTSLHNWDQKSDSTLYAYWTSDYSSISITKSNYSQYFTVTRTCKITGSGHNNVYPCTYTYKVTFKQSTTLGPNTAVNFTFMDSGVTTSLSFKSTNVSLGATVTSSTVNLNSPSTSTVTVTPLSVSGTLYIK